jgi:4-diphosphocytidyl-2-C-methyl-D-erythritol kinase
MTQRVEIYARAKLNLSLTVLAREASGFHQIETLFCAIALADEIEVAIDAGGGDGGGIELDVVGPVEDEGGAMPDLGPTTSNLAYRAAEQFFDAAGLTPRAQIRLTKRIPAGAGLGGGSSDAAAVLGALNSLHGHPLTTDDLLRLGARLGSDVPFFLAGTDLARAWGRGGRLTPLPPLPSRPVLLAVPTQRVATADAYAALAASRAADFAAPPAILAPPAGWSDVAAMAHNDFEELIFRRHPRLAEIRSAIAGAGAAMARMTGSGSVIFGIFESPAAATAALQTLQPAHPDVSWILTST